jgi:haloalkane dehalogenase
VICRLMLTALFLASVSGCKVQVQVPDNGRVTSVSGNYLCEASQTCEIEVIDLLFNETFIAEPAEGYQFDGWRREPSYLCGGRTNTCPIVTSGFEGSEVLMEILASDKVFFLEPVFTVCKLPDDEIVVQTAAAGIEFVRTPTACFDSLDGYDFEPNYVNVAGLRYHYVDEGPRDGEVILMLHGQPSWSYLYRKMIPVLAEAGYRVIAPDHIGMGRSDKPVDPCVHQFEQHVTWMKSFVSQLGLADITLFVQDWGSHIGLRMAGDDPENFARIVVANGDLAIIPEGLNPFTVPVYEFDETIEGTIDYLSQRPPDRVGSFQHWMNFAATAPHLFAADMIELATVNELTEAQFNSYNAPYPARIYWGAIRAFPSMIAGIEQQNVPAYEALGRFERPFMFIGGESDPNQGSVENQIKWISHVPGAAGQPHTRYEAGHFIQEDVGVEMAEHVTEFIQRNPTP